MKRVATLFVAAALLGLLSNPTSSFAQSDQRAAEQAKKTEQHSQSAATGTKTPETRKAESNKGPRHTFLSPTIR